MPTGALAQQVARRMAGHAQPRRQTIGISWNPAPAATSPAPGSVVAFTHAYSKANQRSGQSVSDNSWINYPAATPTVSYTADALNRYTAVGAVSPTYDGNSNLTFDGTFTLGYDAENRLTSASGAGNTASYTFDAQGRRKTRTVNGATTVFVTDADNREVLEYDGSSGAIQRWYAYGLGANAVLSQSNVVAGTRAALIPDIQGSVIASLDSSSGSFSKAGYLPYGKSANAPGTFGFTGQRIDPETNGLYYYRARHYSPAWGRFLQPDPMGYGGGVNLYAYVGNDPLNLIDPTGTWGLLFSSGGELTAGASPYYAPGQGAIPSGAFASGTVALGIFSTGTFGVSATGGVGAYQDPGKSNALPDQTIQPYVSGFSLSKGVAISVTTAQNNQDLSGISSVSDVNLGIVQFQTVKGTNAAGEPVTTWTLSPCLCAGYAKYQTDTAASPSEDIIPSADGQTSGTKPPK